MIAAEEPTDIVITGTAGLPCALTIEFGDGTRQSVTVGDASPFPLKIAHAYPKMSDPTVRVAGAASANLPACEGQVDATIHVSPAGSKIEFITLSTSCPEGWKLVGTVNPDNSFSCTPIPESNAPTNLIHCIDGMKYFAQAGRIGCRHPAALAMADEKAVKGKPTKGKGAATTATKSSATATDPDGTAAKKPGAAAGGKSAPPAAKKPAGSAPKKADATTAKKP